MSKVILITEGPDYKVFFQSLFSDWEISQVETINQMWSGLNAGSLPSDASIVIFNSGYYNKEGYGDMEQAIETLWEHATVFVISYENDTEQLINLRLRQLNGTPNPEPTQIFSYIRTDNPHSDIINGLQKWVDYKKTATTAENKTSNNLKGLDTIIKSIGSNIVSNIDLPPLDKRGIIVASTSSKGGSGKTTIALCTATALYHSSRLAVEKGLRSAPFNVVVIDMDIRDGQVGFLLGKDKPTILNLWIQNRTEPQMENIEDFLHYHEGMGVYALLAPLNAKTAGLVTREYYQKLIYQLSLKFDVVIIDTSVNYLEKVFSEVVLPIVDVLLFVTNMSKGSVFGMSRWVQTIVDDEDSRISRDKIGIVINQAMENVGVALDDIVKHGIGIDLMTAIPSDGAAVVKATNEYRLQDIVLNHPTIGDKYFTIAKKIVKKMGGPDAYIVSPQKGTVFARDELINKLQGEVGNIETSRVDPLAPKAVQ